MTDDHDRVQERARVQDRAAHLLPEEQRVGSDDPEAQAQAVLAESDDREAYRESTPDLYIDHRRSDETAH